MKVCVASQNCETEHPSVQSVNVPRRRQPAGNFEMAQR
jgi:hypothetical protein